MQLLKMILLNFAMHIKLQGLHCIAVIQKTAFGIMMK